MAASAVYYAATCVRLQSVVMTITFTETMVATAQTAHPFLCLMATGKMWHGFSRAYDFGLPHSGKKEGAENFLCAFLHHNNFTARLW
jgi:hypothetical protein